MSNTSIDSSYNEKYQGFDVQIQDQYSDIVNYYMRQQVRQLSIASSTIDAYTITVSNATGVVINNFICVQEGLRAFQGKILSINGNILTLDRPLDYSFTSSATCFECKFDMNVNGSVTAQKFNLNPITGVKFDVYSICISILDQSAMDDNTFGGLTKLTKGIVLRKANTVHRTIFNAKSNGDLKIISGINDIYSNKAPAGYYGLNVFYDVREHNGVAIRLDGNNNERLELIIQDDLVGLDNMRVFVQGHVVED